MNLKELMLSKIFGDDASKEELGPRLWNNFFNEAVEAIDNLERIERKCVTRQLI